MIYLKILTTLLIAASVMLSGCTAPLKNQPDSADMPGWVSYLQKSPSVKAIRNWPVPPELREIIPYGYIVETAHYEIVTTVEDPLLLGQTAMLLESAYNSYTQPLNANIVLQEKLKVVYMAQRVQWEAYTQWFTRYEAPMYLRIKSGAYCHKGVCVTYHIDRDADFAVIAHEGWHQFCQHAFQYRLPAWLDEGMATNFESFELNHSQVRFTPGRNGGRLFALRDALTQGTLFPLADLLRMDPGMAIRVQTHDPSVISPEISAYYAQVYALVRFLREYEYGRHYENLSRLLTHAATGQWPLTQDQKNQALQRQTNPSRHWNIQVGPMLFETYIPDDIAQIEQEYLLFCQQIVLALRRVQ